MINETQITESHLGKPVVQLAEIGQIALTVRDLPKAKAFYKDTLGLTFLFDAGTMVFFQCGTVRIMVGLPEGSIEDTPANTGTILYFKVENIQATYEALKAAGVVFPDAPHLVARMPDHELWMASFRDPDWNVLELMSEVRAG